MGGGQQVVQHHDFVAGIVYVRHSSFVSGLLALSSITSLFGRSYQQLLPIFAVDVLHHGTTGYGFLLSAPGAGSFAGVGSVAGTGSLGGVGTGAGVLVVLGESVPEPVEGPLEANRRPAAGRE